jgi:hypothetical protein
MADVVAFIDHNRDLIAAAPRFTQDGFTHEQVYRQYLPQVKNPTFPCITLSFEKEKMEVFADVAVGMLYVSVHMKKFSTTQSVADWISALLRDHKFSDATTTIYKCQEQGGPPTPSYDKETETWESMQGFEVMFL